MRQRTAAAAEKSENTCCIFNNGRGVMEFGGLARHRWRAGACVALWLCAALLAAPVHAQDAAGLQARYASLAERLANNAFHRPLYLESAETSGDSKGDVYAVVDRPFGQVEGALQGMDQWCGMLILHLNVKYCHGAGSGAASVLTVMIGRKLEQPLEDAYRVDFNYSISAANAGYFGAILKAANGPLGTHNYQIMLEAVPVDAHRSFLHLSYSYFYGMAARLAMQAYLGTLGRGKTGFSVTGKSASGEPVYIDGVRGAIERNTMRYYLAIEVYLETAGMSTAGGLDKRLQASYDATEVYAKQLHEVERDEYLQMKRHEIQREANPL